jgi:predicted methyltransferase
VLVIIDHAAADGSPITVTDSLHRIDRAQVITDLTAAGFVLQEETDVLRNPADNRTERVFESDIRGHTDQFALRFVKPAN